MITSKSKYNYLGDDILNLIFIFILSKREEFFFFVFFLGGVKEEGRGMLQFVTLFNHLFGSILKSFDSHSIFIGILFH